MPDPNPAASLLVIRSTPNATQVLMARRGAGHRFMPNVLVFPGGRVDPEDYDAKVASSLKPEVRERLLRHATPGLARALAVAAARELTEEVGMSLGDPPELAPLSYLCRAITPADRPVRFDARFFIVDVAHVTGEPAGSQELEDPGWYTIEQALAGNLALATKAVLGQFQLWLTQPDPNGKVPVLADRAWTYQ
jgi:8-oxo-dGTP pyrophosphatase MutT (NUDIX family)